MISFQVPLPRRYGVVVIYRDLHIEECVADEAVVAQVEFRITT